MVVEDGFLSNENILELQQVVNGLLAGGGGGTFDTVHVHDGVYVSAAGVDLSALDPAVVPPFRVFQGNVIPVASPSLIATLQISPLVTHGDDTIRIDGVASCYLDYNIGDDSEVIPGQPIDLVAYDSFWIPWLGGLVDDLAGINALTLRANGQSVVMDNFAIFIDNDAMTPDADGGFVPLSGSVTLLEGESLRAWLTSPVRFFVD